MTRAPYARNSATSKAAADAIEPVLPFREYEVMRFILERGYVGATDDELQEHFTAPPFNWASPTARARRVRLCEKGLLRDSGGRRLTQFKRMAIVWVSTENEPDLFEGRSDR